MKILIVPNDIMEILIVQSGAMDDPYSSTMEVLVEPSGTIERF